MPSREYRNLGDVITPASKNFNINELSISTYPDILSVDEELRYLDRRTLDAVPELLLIFGAHKHVPVLVFYHVRPQDLFNLHAGVISLSNDAHRRRIYHNLLCVL